MKKLVLTFALLLGIVAAQAQTTLTGSKLFDNVSVTLKGGAISPLQHYAFFKNARGIFGLELRKQITPVFGLGVEGEATINTTSWNKPIADWSDMGLKSKNMIDHLMVGGFGSFNLTNLFFGYKGTPRTFEFEAVMGAGWLHGFMTNRNVAYGNVDLNSWYTKVGANFNFNLGAAKAFTVSLKPAIVWDMNGDANSNPRKYTNASQSRMSANHAAVEMQAGITYHFKNSNGTHHFTLCDKLYSQADLDLLNGQINDLRSQLAGAQSALDDCNARNAQLQRELDECKSRKPETKVINDKSTDLRILVHFKVNKTNITADQQPNVERVASYLKSHPNATVTVRGYASPEGPEDVNIRLANGRAEAVKNMLVNKYKIAANRIDAKGNGISNMFEELSWNRVSICDIVINDK